MTTEHASEQRLEALRTSAGRYAMVAIDQRESLRAMYPLTSDGGYVDDPTLKGFKQEAVGALSPEASAVLLDSGLGLPAGRPDTFAPGTGLIVAADVLHQPTGQPLQDTSLDPEITADYLRAVDAHAVKLLVLWRRSWGQQERERLIRSALELAARAEVATLVEGIVRTDDGQPWKSSEDRDAAILDAAREICGLHPDVYKAEVPGYAPGDVSRVREQSERMSEIVGSDWVVLSNGVRQEDFPSALTEAMHGGANGFLAGRAVWIDIVGEQDERAAFRNRAVPRLRALREIADETSSTGSGSK